MEKWLLDKHKELAAKTNVLVNKRIGPTKLSGRMADFAGDFGFVVAEAVQADRDYSIEKLAWDEWYHQQLLKVSRKDKVTNLKTAEALIIEDNVELYRHGRERLIEKENIKKACDGWVRVWAALKDIYIEMARLQLAEGRSGTVEVSGEPKISEGEKKIRRMQRATGRG